MARLARQEETLTPAGKPYVRRQEETLSTNAPHSFVRFQNMKSSQGDEVGWEVKGRAGYVLTFCILTAEIFLSRNLSNLAQQNQVGARFQPTLDGFEQGHDKQHEGESAEKVPEDDLPRDDPNDFLQASRAAVCATSCACGNELLRQRCSQPGIERRGKFC